MRVQNGVGLLERQKGRAGGWSGHRRGALGGCIAVLSCILGGASFRIALLSEVSLHVGDLSICRWLRSSALGGQFWAIHEGFEGSAMMG